MKNLFILPHLGLGDAILTNGLIRSLAREWDHIVFPSKKINLPSVRWMVGDLDNVEVLPVNDDDDAIEQLKAFDGDRLKLGYFGNEAVKANEHFDEAFYRQGGVPFESKWTAFKVPERRHIITNPEVGIFLVEDPGRGYRIQRNGINRSLKVTEPHYSETIFDWKPWILNAKEIHAIDSAFMCWIDLMPETGQPLYWHKYARRNEDWRHHPKLHRPWQILD